MKLALYLVLPLALFFLLAYAIMIFLTPQATEPPAGPVPNGAEECTNGETEDCSTSKGCDGYRTCTNGLWSPCITKRECTPGTSEPCALNICTLGERICDECGQWGRCLPKENGG